MDSYLDLTDGGSVEVQRTLRNDVDILMYFRDVSVTLHLTPDEARALAEFLTREATPGS